MEKGLDLLLSRIKPNHPTTIPAAVSSFLESVFVRIQRAKRLLSSTSLSIIDIAASVGVEDQSYFSRLFKKETGITPSAFRKRMQG